MTVLNRIGGAIGGRRLVGIIGVLYVLVATGRALVESLDGEPLGNVLVVSLLIAGPGVALCYGWYRLPRSDIDPEFYPTVAGWCLAGLGTMTTFLVLYELQPTAGISSPARSPPILTAFSAAAGFAVGVHDGRAKTRTREVERRNRELERTQMELEETVDELRTSNERLEQFAHAASHDLQEPLRMVSTYLQLLEQRHGDDLDDDAEEFLEFAVDGADRMREMVDGLLHYSRVETRGEPLEPVDLEAVVDDVLADLRMRIDETDAEVSVDTLPRVEGDGSQLRQLVQNLLENAIEYSGDEPPQVRVFAERNGSMWTISVEDEGIGIDADDQELVFDVFERGHSHSEHRGSGIGLALCERIVERHGGEIWVDSDPGEGATFSFTLPAVRDGAQ